jgi:hypothetical protein
VVNEVVIGRELFHAYAPGCLDGLRRDAAQTQDHKFNPSTSLAARTFPMCHLVLPPRSWCDDLSMLQLFGHPIQFGHMQD